jgi:prefoldin subunit 5
MSDAGRSTQPQRAVGMTVVIALVTVIIVLAGSLGYLAFHQSSASSSSDQKIASLSAEISSEKSTITSLNSTISSLNSDVASLQSQMNSLNSTISSLNATKLSLQYQMNSLNSTISSLTSEKANLTTQLTALEQIIELGKSLVLEENYTVSQGPGSYSFSIFNVSYAGYIQIQVLSSTTANTYGIVIWSANGVSYDNSTAIGHSGSAYFPVLPAPRVEIGVGNSNSLTSATETVTITYWY